MFDWNDVRHFLAVARTGSTLTASRQLKLSQPTVARRVAALEEALGVTLFERRQAGYRLTEEGEALVADAAAMETAALAVADGAKARARRLSGSVRLTCNEITAAYHLAPILAEFRRAYPDIRVDLAVTEALLDLGRGEADVAIRATDRPEGSGIVARKLLDMPWIVYAARSYVETHGQPEHWDDIAAGHRIIGGEGAISQIPALQWFEGLAAAGAVVARANSFPALIANVRAGLGLAPLASGIFDRDAEIISCLTLPARFSGPVWLVTHERVRGLPRVRALLDFIATYVSARRAILAPALPNAAGGAYMAGDEQLAKA
jgi:DNA-binding transcriptional LysR family regulator